MKRPHIETLLFILALATVALLFLLWPGDAPFINDEPKLFLSAYSANLLNELAKTGLVGSVGLTYGPLPTWIYQGLIAITRNPEAWVVSKALFMFLLMAIGLWLLSRALGLWKWFIPIVLVSPYIWFYSRHLWDNSFLLPFSALALGAYANCLVRKSSALFLLSIITTVILPLIHPIGLPMTFTMLLHMAFFARKELMRLWIPLCVIGAFLLFVHLPYFSSFLSNLRQYTPPVADETKAWWSAWLFPFMGGRLLTSFGLEYFFEQGWLPGHRLFLALKIISGVGYVAVLYGIVAASQKVWLSVRHGSLGQSMADPTRLSVSTHFSMIGLVAFTLYLLMCGLSKSYGEPHYYNGLWIVFVFFAWLGVDKMVKIKAGCLGMALYGISLAAVCAIVISLVHERGGNRGLYYGPTIRNQLEVAYVLGRNDRSAIQTSIPQFMYTPSLAALKILCVKDDTQAIPGPIIIRYESNDELSGRVMAVRSKEE